MDAMSSTYPGVPWHLRRHGSMGAHAPEPARTEAGVERFGLSIWLRWGGGGRVETWGRLVSSLVSV